MFCYKDSSFLCDVKVNEISAAPGRMVIIEFCPHVCPNTPPGPWSLQLNYETRVTWHVRSHKRHVLSHVARGDCWDCGGQHPGSFRVISLHPINFCNSTIDNKPGPQCAAATVNGLITTDTPLHPWHFVRETGINWWVITARWRLWDTAPIAKQIRL